ncbi:hypothetical protein FPSE_04670 [Fusarium pseudograminearum CS3096]|uniref:Uncharacterized protein n=1 Tax=Fusarium pseudograminearum (strain CS3096) TaxID=1028729 RepID=K3VK06_FUSPC|nr:hypothetical protein FPSE_04670 [Fusarium pseudograminearum CS3096]EKJ75112.1 hypothetical protein FPSE_04670 [Fusarium pseudograminearum CS3096]
MYMPQSPAADTNGYAAKIPCMMRKSTEDLRHQEITSTGLGAARATRI